MLSLHDLSLSGCIAGRTQIRKNILMAAKQSSSPNDKDILSLRATGRVIDLDAVPGEFELMKSLLKKPLTVQAAIQVCRKSGTHLLKTINPRTDSNQCCLYFREPDSDTRPDILPSVPAGSIPFSKVLFHPFEIAERSPRSIVDDINNPDEISDFILDAFANVFGEDVLEAIREALLNRINDITELPSGGLPIVFAPRENGDDLQFTPISPAAAFRNMQDTINAFYERKKENGEQLPGRFSFPKQLISSKPQNISPMINGTRRRFMARMPTISDLTMSEFHEFATTGIFPRWRDRDIANFVLQYANLLERDDSSDNIKIQMTLDRMADRLIRCALDFIQETKTEIRLGSGHHEGDYVEPADPGPVKVLLGCQYRTDIGKARDALAGAHFSSRLAILTESVRIAT